LSSLRPASALIEIRETEVKVSILNARAIIEVHFVMARLFLFLFKKKCMPCS
jgi:hypothetical protein